MIRFNNKLQQQRDLRNKINKVNQINKILVSNIMAKNEAIKNLNQNIQQKQTV